MRFSLADSQGPGGIEQTLLYNLSETGAAFLTTQPRLFELGDFIKVEIPIPNGDQFASWARVVRIEEFEYSSHWTTSRHAIFEKEVYLVATKFESLPKGHVRALRKGIEQCFIQAMRDQQYRNWLYYKALFSTYLIPGLIYFFLTLLAVGFIYYFSLPDPQYDSKKGAPWGQRFKF